MTTSVPERVATKKDLGDAELQLRTHRDEMFCERTTRRDSDERHDSNFQRLDDRRIMNACVTGSETVERLLISIKKTGW
jgi:hypothetical protein